MRCVTCKKTLKEDAMFVYNGRGIASCSSECFASFLSAEKEKEDRNFLYKEICRIFNIPEMNGKLYAEVKRTMETHKLTYKNLAAVLHYMYDIAGMKKYSPTLFYVPQYIARAKNYYQQIREREVTAVEAIKKNENRTNKIVKPNYNGKTRKQGLKINPEDV